MRKIDIIRRIVEETACTQAQADAAVAAILATIKEGLQEGAPVLLRRFGRNPQSGAAATIAARRVVRFTASQTVKQVVEGAATAVE